MPGPVNAAPERPAECPSCGARSLDSFAICSNPWHDPAAPSPATGLPTLSFAQLRAANIARLPLFKNPKGEPAHDEPDGSDWSLGEWCNAVLGELGEAANLVKKVRRGDMTLDEVRPALARELADVATYLDLLAFRAGVDLGEATATKWNEISARIGVPLKIEQFAGERDREDAERFRGLEQFVVGITTRCSDGYEEDYERDDLPDEDGEEFREWIDFMLKNSRANEAAAARQPRQEGN